MSESVRAAARESVRAAARDSVRAFFAVELPELVRSEAVRVVEALRLELPRGVRWVPDHNLHLTLKFLGQVSRDALPKLLARAAARLVRETAFPVTLTGAGAFPNARGARVLWIGIGEGRGQLAKLARKLDAAGKGVGASRDRRPYRAHLTVGRLREPRPIALERVPGPDACGFSVDEVVLYESRLSSSGSVYTPLARLPLGADVASALEFAPEP